MAKKTTYLGSIGQNASLMSDFRSVIQSQVDRTSLAPSLFMQNNFSHPKDNRLGWSFVDHEFQIDIIDDAAIDLCVKKCAQIGLSTIQILWVLTFCAQHNFLKLAYVLPTAKFANEFSALRVKPIIDNSPTILSLLSDDVDNSGAKGIGTCHLVMRGTSGDTQAISIDLDAIAIDELNFCNQKTLSSMESRLQHSDLKLKRKFSTPTLPGFGISSEFDQSSQANRLIKCEHCENWVMLDFFKDVVIPGFDRDLKKEYRKGDHLHPGVKHAWYKCPSCSNEITSGVLNDPERRQWVHKFHERDYHGYQVRPWDVPRYNPLPHVLVSIKDRSYHDWVNFVLGDDHQDEENSFSLEKIALGSVLPVYDLMEVFDGRIKLSNVFIGADIGKVYHVAIGALDSSGRLAVVCIGRVSVEQLVKMYGEANFGRFLYELSIKTGAIRTVVDHAPSWEPALYLHGHMPTKGFGAYYEGDKKGQLDIYSFDGAKGVVTIMRTKHFDDLSQAVNSGGVLFPRVDGGLNHEMTLMQQHLDTMKKMVRFNSKGIAEEYWESTSDEDHYAHALGYLWTAFASVEKRFAGARVVMPPTVRAIPYGKRAA